MSGWRPALRIARREARRAKGRSALVLAMIALPVAVLSFVAVSYDMFSLSKTEELERRLGQADAVITSDTDILAQLPTGSRVLRESEGQAAIHSGDGPTLMTARETDLADPLQRGRVNLLAGKAPTRADEIALTRQAARALGVGVGDSLQIADPSGVFKITAIAEYPASLTEIVVFHPDSPLVAHTTFWLASIPGGLGWEEAVRLNGFGTQVESRALDDQGTEVTEPEQLALGVIVAGLAVLQIVLLCGPAFAVGARRRARELALIAAAGARPQQLRRIVLADGLVLGVGGAFVGLVAGVGLAAAARPLLEEFVMTARAGGWRFFPLALLGIAGLAVTTGLLAAMVPAWTAARLDVVLVLNGRRGITRSRRRWIVTGIGLVLVGMVIASLGAVGSVADIILFGLILPELGLVFITPALIGFVARAARWLPLAPRLALRGTARNRSSAAPAISAVMAAVAGAVAAGVFSASSDQQAIDRYQPALPHGYVGVQAFAALGEAAPGEAAPDWAEAARVVEEVLPSANAVPYRMADVLPLMPQRFLRPWVWSIVDDGSALDAFTGADPGDLAAARRMLAGGGVVVTDPEAAVDGYVTILLNEQPITLPAYVLTSGVPGVSLVLPPSLGIPTQAQGLIVQTAVPPSQEQEDALRIRLAELSPAIQVQIERGPEPSTSPIELVLALAAVAIALGATGIATGLAVADSRPELATLAAVGAHPALRRKLSLSQAGLISGLGAALGTLTGLGTAGALIIATNQLASSFDAPVPFVVPWTTIAVVVAAPLLAMAGAGLLTRSGLPIERRF